MDIVHIVHVTVHWISCQTLDRSQSLFYFVPQESHSQVDSAGQTWSLGSFGKVTILSQSQIFWHKKSKSESQSKTQPVKLIKGTPQLRSLLQTKESQDMRSFTRRSRDLWGYFETFCIICPYGANSIWGAVCLDADDNDPWVKTWGRDESCHSPLAPTLGIIIAVASLSSSSSAERYPRALLWHWFNHGCIIAVIIITATAMDGKLQSCTHSTAEDAAWFDLFTDGW